MRSEMTAKVWDADALMEFNATNDLKGRLGVKYARVGSFGPTQAKRLVIGLHTNKKLSDDDHLVNFFQQMGALPPSDPLRVMVTTDFPFRLNVRHTHHDSPAASKQVPFKKKVYENGEIFAIASQWYAVAKECGAIMAVVTPRGNKKSYLSIWAPTSVELANFDAAISQLPANPALQRMLKTVPIEKRAG